MKLLMCQPRHFAIEYEINPWMNTHCSVDLKKATEQWNALYQTIQNCGAEVELVEPEPGLPDMIFTANAGFVYQNKVLLSHFKHSGRQGEEKYFASWFRQAGYSSVETKPKTQPVIFEGEGDALLADNKLFLGYGMRSDKRYGENFSQLNVMEIVPCELIDPCYYHLDTCFSPLSASHALWWPAAFSDETKKRLEKSIKLIPLPEEEAKRFACNAIVLGKKIIIPSGCSVTTHILEDLGFQVYSCEMSEFIKAGGACKCLTLFLERSI